MSKHILGLLLVSILINSLLVQASPVHENKEESCGEFEYFAEKKGICEATCEWPIPPEKCENWPDGPCKCIDGYVRDWPTDKCVRFFQCTDPMPPWWL